MRYTNKLLLASVAALGLGFSAAAAVNVPTLITVDTAYTAAQNPIFLKDATLVTNGASLTFGPGCIVVTLPADDGGLVIARGAQIFVNGTKDAPVIMTSAADVATWTGTVFAGPASAPTNITTVGDPSTGTHRTVQQEWRNLTIMGNAVISASFFGSGAVDDPDTGLPNPTVVNGTASKTMEGLDSGDEQGQGIGARTYGQGNDNDDSGSVKYLSLRYTGRVIGSGNELNGLSLGGIGRGTDISHVDIMNNVDDGIEIWGGTVNLKYFNIWNVGDDSFDVDQGWRGKAQFGLIVQGFAAGTGGSEGSGISDNIFETDGAEQSDVQPYTTAAIYNVTAIGQPISDQATAWRDNARVQYRNMMFLDFGGRLVSNDNTDGDGGLGYGISGNPTFVSLWSTSAATLPTVNQGAGAYTPANLYTTNGGAQDPDGRLCEITNSLVWTTTNTTGAGDLAYALGVLEGTNAVPQSSGASANSFVKTTLPIAAYTRAGAVHSSGNYTLVSALDPRPVAPEAILSVGAAEADGFFTPAPYKGGFSPNNNWAEGWTAADAFGFFVNTGTNAADPTLGSITLAAKLNFPTVDGVFYTVFESADGITFVPMATVEGDGGTISVADLDDFDPSKLYKVEAQ